MVVEVIDTTDEYAALAARCFDLPAIRALLARPDFSMAIDGMHGASGPYLRKVLADLLGCEPAALRNCKPLPDFGGGHPDPNLTYAPDLVRYAPRGATARLGPARG
jgi:phosphoglucomutase